MQKDIYFHSEALRKEFDNQFNKFAVTLLNGEEMISHLPCKYSRIACIPANSYALGVSLTPAG